MHEKVNITSVILEVFQSKLRTSDSDTDESSNTDSGMDTD